MLKRRIDGGLMPTLRSNLSELFDMDRLLDEPFMGTSFWDNRRFARLPATNIREINDEFIVELAAPGMKKNDFHINIDNNILEIKVEKEEESSDIQKSFTRREYNFNAFYRSFNLPDTVLSEKIKAEYKDGLLQIHLPKVAEAKKKVVKEIAVV